jgi:hypothetical protein
MSIFSKNNKKKIALALACASIFGDKSSLAAQNTGKVGGAIASSKKMGDFTKGFITGGCVIGGTILVAGYAIANEIAGYNGSRHPLLVKFSFARLYAEHKEAKEQQQKEQALEKQEQEDRILSEKEKEVKKIADYIFGIYNVLLEKNKEVAKKNFIAKYSSTGVNFDEAYNLIHQMNEDANNYDKEFDYKNYADGIMKWVPNEYFESLDRKNIKYFIRINANVDNFNPDFYLQFKEEERRAIRLNVFNNTFSRLTF